MYLPHPFPIPHTRRQVHSISAICAAVLRFRVERLRCPDVVLALLLRPQSSQLGQIESLAASSAGGEEEVTGRDIRRIGWMLKNLPVPGIQHVKKGLRDMRRRIVMEEDDTVLQQLLTLLLVQITVQNCIDASS